MEHGGGVGMGAVGPEDGGSQLEEQRLQWCIIEDCFDASRAGHRETVCALGNGYLGVRGAPEDGHPASTPATLMAGVFDAAPGGVPELVVAPNWLGMRVLIDGEEFGMASGGVLDFRRTLDMRDGVLEREVRWRDGRGRTTRLTWRRIVSMADVHAAAISLSIEAEDHDCGIVVDLTLDGNVSDAKAAHLDVIDRGWDGDGCYLVARTRASGVVIAEAAVVAVSDDEAEVLRQAPADGAVAGISLGIRCRRGRPVTIEKHVGFGTSLDHATAIDTNGVEGARAVALSAARRGAACRFAGLLEEHRRVWRAIWDRCDIIIGGDDFAQKAVRFAIFQMVQAAPRHTDRVSIGARGLSGEGYRGHVFWDTETFVVPFFTFTLPEIARNLLGYRYHTLPAARRNAASKGYRGAMFAWESADTGEETTPSWGDPHPVTGERRRILCGDLEHHITADVAYAVWQYCVATADEEFLLQKGAEILIETGRFWASRASHNPALQAYEILHVIGPDEYHEDVNNNFYTNAMARWNIRAALATCDYLKGCHPSEWARLASAIGVTQQELAHMADVAARLVCGRVLAAPCGGGGTQPRSESAVIEQFDGFWDLADVEVPADDGRFGPMEAIIGSEALAGSRVVKQPDVLMALYLLEDDIREDIAGAVGIAGTTGVADTAGVVGGVGVAGGVGSAGTPGAGSQGYGWAGELLRGGASCPGRRGFRWDDVLRANWGYYEPRTDHGSSLSCSIHSGLASRLGLGEEARRYFLRAARIDLADAIGNAVNGVHMATQGGLWQAVVNGFAGVRMDMSTPRPREPQEYTSPSGRPPEDAVGLAPWSSSGFSVNPRLPAHWKSVSVPLAWRGTRVRMHISRPC